MMVAPDLKAIVRSIGWIAIQTGLIAGVLVLSMFLVTGSFVWSAALWIGVAMMPLALTMLQAAGRSGLSGYLVAYVAISIPFFALFAALKPGEIGVFLGFGLLAGAWAVFLVLGAIFRLTGWVRFEKGAA